MVEPLKTHGPFHFTSFNCRISSAFVILLPLSPKMTLRLYALEIVLIHFFFMAEVLFTVFYLFVPLSYFPIAAFLVQVDVLLSGLLQFWNAISLHFLPQTAQLLQLLLLPHRNTHCHTHRYYSRHQLKFNLQLFHCLILPPSASMIHLRTYRLLQLPSNSNCRSHDTYLI